MYIVAFKLKVAAKITPCLTRTKNKPLVFCRRTYHRVCFHFWQQVIPQEKKPKTYRQLATVDASQCPRQHQQEFKSAQKNSIWQKKNKLDRISFPVQKYPAPSQPHTKQ
ncbi:hypothetical protein AMECASPLE_036083 [Ameca splendens]|uniref:Uncharacterized protein n=1 Tax=Ameca splendens TaxID=208324 RepID=A0ABV0ZSK9_9TELE